MRLTLDFETQDPHLDTLGSGWVHGDIDVLGMAYKIDDGPEQYTRDITQIEGIVKNATTIVAHNLQYDVGILLMLGIDISGKLLIDTMVLGKLVNNVLRSYSLDNLSSHYLGSHKSDVALGLAAIKHRLYKVSKRKGPRTDAWKKRTIKAAINFAKRNMKLMDLVVPDLVHQYALKDVNLTDRLYKRLIPEAPKDWVNKISRLYKILLKQRQTGIRIDTDRLEEVRRYLFSKESKLLRELREISCSEEFNPNSPKDLPELLTKLNIPFPVTAKGNPSITKDWLETQDSHVCKLISQYRRYQKVRRDFCDAVIDAQEKLPLDKRGRVYPEFRIFGATTGRFSCSKPNIQQIPSRDPELGPLIRSIYIPEEGEKWYSLDFSSQESRLQIHYAALVGAEGGEYWAHEYTRNPNLDLHAVVAELAGISRSDAKAINLGLSYGMGKGKLAESLGLSDYQAKILVDKYYNAVPYLKDLDAACKEAMSKRGYITTLGGRKSFVDPPVYEGGKKRSFEYKALNKLIQGSAADQIIYTLLELDKLGISVIASIHDEINLSAPSREVAEKVKQVMETCIPLKVPMVTEIGVGNNWAEAK